VILKLLSYNIRFAGSGRESRLAEVIRTVSPDLVVFQEATDTRIIEGLAKAADFPFWAAQRAHSIAFLSRVEISYHEWHYPAGAKHSFLEIVVAGTEARIFGLHLRSMFSKWTERRRALEIKALLKGIERHQHGFHVIVGDFNTLAPGEMLDVRRMPAWIRALVWMSGRDIQRDTIQVMLDARYADGFRLRNPELKGYTFPTWDPHLRLDYVFVPIPFAERLIDCEVITTPAKVAGASDHFPVLAQLEI
jgi:endonuclease/exonuclease/phosphatase family metal-dependent hydrolase